MHQPSKFFWTRCDNLPVRLLSLILLMTSASTFANKVFANSIVKNSAVANSAPLSESNSQVTVTLSSSLRKESQYQLAFQGAPRLRTVLEYGQQTLNNHGNADIYWLGAGLYDQSTSTQRKQILNQLNLLSQQVPELSSSLIALHGYLSEAPLAKRYFIPLDLSTVQVTPKYNPIIDKNLTLVLPKRPNTVLVTGALSSPPQTSNWEQRKSAKAYLKQLTTLNRAESDWVNVIQPDGVVERHPIAYWNFTHHDLAPGAIIFVRFAGLPSPFDSLNDDIVELLRSHSL